MKQDKTKVNFQVIEISDRQFLKLSELVSSKFGIKLPLDKKIMFQSRLQPRLKELGMESFELYCNYVFQRENINQELTPLIDLVSTNKTEFFREKQHFDLIKHKLMPEMFEKVSNVQNQFLRCWSAGCSSGQEAYSLAMTFEDYKLTSERFFDYHILGTDVSESMLDTANSGIYPFQQCELIPEYYRKRYVMKSKDEKNQRIKMMKLIRSKTEFRYSNLMDSDYGITSFFNLIFIRNTLIYFNRENQYKILKRICERLVPGGYLFIGHSESLINLDLPIRVISPSVYQKFQENE